MTERSIRQVLDGYAGAADAAFIARYEAISNATMLAPFVGLFPVPPATVLDIGAGTGRDAGWLAERGYNVTAVEPVAALREAGQRRYASPRIHWRDDRLPLLASVTGRFDFILLSGVWQHLDDVEREVAMRQVGAFINHGGMVLMSLRHGPGASGRLVHAISDAATIALAAANGLNVALMLQAESIQPENRAAGVMWTWLALRRIAR